MRTACGVVFNERKTNIICDVLTAAGRDNILERGINC